MIPVRARRPPSRAGLPSLIAALLVLLTHPPAHAQRAVQRLEPPARADVQDLVETAARLQLGLGVEADAGRAMALYCRAALLGSRPAALAIAGWLLADQGPDYNPELAADWLHRSQFLERGRRPPRPIAVPRCPTDAPSGLPSDMALLGATVERLAQSGGVDATLVKAVITIESSWDRTAISPAGAAGLMQLMPGTATRLAVADRLDVEQNIRGGVAELRRLLGVYAGNVPLALAAYNAGEQAVNRCSCVPDNGETLDYVNKIRRLLIQAGRWDARWP